MKKVKLNFLIILLGIILHPIISNGQATDTIYINTTHVMMAQGQILSNAVTNRICYTLDGSKMLEEKVVVDMSYPDGDGGTNVNRTEEELTVMDGLLNFYKGNFTTNDSLTSIIAEKEGDNLVISGNLRASFFSFFAAA